MIRLTIILLTLMLTACQTPAPITDGGLPTSNQSLVRWNLNGRLGYRAGNDGGSASLEWRQRDVSGEIHFSGPLGFGSAEIRWAPGEAILDTGKEQMSAGTTAALAWRITGLWLPIEALEFWVRGLPFPDSEFDASRDELGQLTGLEQLGWQLEFDRYQAIAGGVSLPHKIRATREDQRFTLLVHNWEPLP